MHRRRRIEAYVKGVYEYHKLNLFFSLMKWIKILKLAVLHENINVVVFLVVF